MEIILIVAMSKNRVIGKNKDIPWHIKEDFEHFKEKTLGYPCIMGRKTYQSLPDHARPLPGRENIVLTSQDKPLSGATIFHNFNKAIEYCQKKDTKKIFIIGGAGIYKLGLQIADTLELTLIDKVFEGDTFFPEIDYSQWKLTKQKDLKSINLKTGEELNFSFLTYKKNE